MKVISFIDLITFIILLMYVNTLFININYYIIYIYIYIKLTQPIQACDQLNS